MIRRILLGLGLGLLVLLSLLGWVLGTQSGGAWALSRALGDSGSFEAFRGSLLGSAEIEGLIYRAPAQEIRAQRASLRWHPGALLQGLVHVESLQVQGLDYRQLETRTPSEEPQEPAGAPPALPVDIRLDEALLRDARITTPDGQWTVDRLATSARLEGVRVHLERLEVDAMDAQARAEGRVDLREGYPFRVELQWSASLPDTGPLAGSGTAEGDLAAIRIEHATTRPFALRTGGRIQLGEALRLELSGGWEEAQWPFDGEPVVRSRSGSFRLAGPMDALELSAQADVQGPELPSADLELSGRLSPERIAEAVLLARLDRGEVRLSGEAGWAPRPAWTLAIEGRELDPALIRPDLEGSLDIAAAAEGGIEAEGLRSRIEVERLTGTLMGRAVDGSAVAALRGDGLTLESLQLNTGPSRLSATGTVGWSPKPSWDLRVRGRDLDPSVGWPAWPGRFDLAAAVEGTLDEAGPRTDLVLDTLEGSLRDQPLSGSGRAHYGPDGLRLEGVRLASGPNSLRADGRIADRLDLSLELKAPDLDASLPGVRGSAEAEGRLTGTAEAPKLDARISGSGLAHPAGRLERLSMEVIWSPDRVQVQADAAELTTGGWGANSLSLRMDGRPEAFDTRLDLDGDDLDVQAALTGGWQDQAWSGRLTALALDHARLGPWNLVDPAGLSLAADRVDAERLCLARENSRLCAAASWSPAESRVTAELDSIALAFARPWLPERTEVQGSASGEADFRLAGGGPEGQAEIRLTPASLSLDLGDEEPLRLAFAEGRIEARADAGGIRADLDLPLADQGGLSANVQLGPPGGAGARSLSGRLDAEMADLSPVELLVPQLSGVKGALRAGIDLGGTTEQPQIKGEALVADASARVPDLGLELTGIRIRAASEGTERLALEAEATSGGGRLQAEGGLGLDPDAGWPVELSLSGSEFQLARLPEAIIHVSPELDVSVDGKAVSVQGTVAVPKAEFEIRQTPKTAVAVSEDEVIVGQAEEAAKKSAPRAVTAELTVRLGDSVRFSGFGLSSRLDGSLDLTASEGQTLAQGEIFLREGRYKAYGQDLTIQRGRLVFGGPLTNPTLDVRATRKSRDGSVTAVLNLSGSLRQPVAQVSSEPPLPEEEALAYLVTGRGLGEGTGDEAALLRQAALTQGLARSQAILDRVAGGIGIDELQVQQGASLEESSLMLGKYLSPNLYVSYALGLFDPQGALVLRYKLTERLRLEAQSGEQQGVDLIYDVETN